MYKRQGLDVLLHAVIHHYLEGPAEHVVTYDDTIEEKIAKLEVVIKARYPDASNLRWHAIKLLEYDEEVMNHHPVDVTAIIDRNYEKDIINPVSYTHLDVYKRQAMKEMQTKTYDLQKQIVKLETELDGRKR